MKTLTTKSKTILNRFLAAVGMWILMGAIIGYLAMPAGPVDVTKSPDNNKEFYLYRPFHRRVIKGMMYFVELPVDLVTAVFTGGGTVGSLYFADFSLYVHDIASGHRVRYSPTCPGVWSPDSRWIAFAGEKENERMPLLLIDHNEQKEYVIFATDSPPNWSVELMTWSMDSAAVFFRQKECVYAVDIAGKTPVVVADEVRDELIDIRKIAAEWKGKAGTEARPNTN